MKYILNNLKKRPTAVMFLVLGIWIGITILLISISYVEGMGNRGRPLNLRDSKYAKFFLEVMRD